MTDVAKMSLNWHFVKAMLLEMIEDVNEYCGIEVIDSYWERWISPDGRMEIVLSVYDRKESIVFDYEEWVDARDFVIVKERFDEFANRIKDI